MVPVVTQWEWPVTEMGRAPSAEVAAGGKGCEPSEAGLGQFLWASEALRLCICCTPTWAVLVAPFLLQQTEGLGDGKKEPRQVSALSRQHTEHASGHVPVSAAGSLTPGATHSTPHAALGSMLTGLQGWGGSRPESALRNAGAAP